MPELGGSGTEGRLGMECRLWKPCVGVAFETVGFPFCREMLPKRRHLEDLGCWLSSFLLFVVLVSVLGAPIGLDVGGRVWDDVVTHKWCILTA